VYHPPAVAKDPSDWFRRRTFHHGRFADTRALARAKAEQGLTVSVCIPALNEESTIAPIVRTIRAELMEGVALVDELVVIDSASSDQTVATAEDAGAVVVQDRDVRPDLEPFSGKGEALWKSLFVLTGDLILWLDADIEQFDPRFVIGPLGPLLTEPDIGYVKSFYERPVRDVGVAVPAGGGRVTELMARPLLNMFWPELSGLIQPLAGEYAGRRSVLEQVPFFTGYGVETGLVIDVSERFGIDSMAQVDLDERHHRNRDIADLSRMAFAVLQVVMTRLASTERIDLRVRPHLELLQYVRSAARYETRPSTIEVRERPPAATVAGYGAR
jgi:glucosyl-3-phosphoglycerate synthase